MITFALVPLRSRVLGAKLIASIILAVALLSVSVGIVAAGVLVASPGVDGDLGRRRAADRSVGGLPDGRDDHRRRVRPGRAGLDAGDRRPSSRSRSRGRRWPSLSVFAGAAPWSDARLALGPLTPAAQCDPVGTRRHRARALDAAPTRRRELAVHSNRGRLLTARRPSWETPTRRESSPGGRTGRPAVGGVVQRPAIGCSVGSRLAATCGGRSSRFTLGGLWHVDPQRSAPSAHRSGSCRCPRRNGPVRAVSIVRVPGPVRAAAARGVRHAAGRGGCWPHGASSVWFRWG